MSQLQLLAPQAAKQVKKSAKLTTLELCAGAGGQALGFEQAGFDHVALVELDKQACQTLRINRPNWNVIHADLREVSFKDFSGVDVVAGGLPCPPFSIAGKQLGEQDERNLFPDLVRVVSEVKPQSVVIENVKGILSPLFREFRQTIKSQLAKLGYETAWKLLNASDFGVPQLRPRVIFIAFRSGFTSSFRWPQISSFPSSTVGAAIGDLMSANGWTEAKQWIARANNIAPTIVGGSHKHGGPDLGPTRARTNWELLGVDGLGIADSAPDSSFSGLPRLTVRMVARIQGFPDNWEFAGRKTSAYRQVGNALPPPFARAVALQVGECLTKFSDLNMAV